MNKVKKKNPINNRSQQGGDVNKLSGATSAALRCIYQPSVPGGALPSSSQPPPFQRPRKRGPQGSEVQVQSQAQASQRRPGRRIGHPGASKIRSGRIRWPIHSHVFRKNVFLSPSVVVRVCVHTRACPGMGTVT